MTWYNAVAGSDIPLRTRTRSRLGVNGFGVDDIGVLANARSIEALMRIGSEVGALNDESLGELFDCPNGTPQQVTLASDLSQRALMGLSDKLSSLVDGELTGVPGVGSPLYAEYTKWARNSAWEFPVGLLDTDVGKCFCLADEPGVSVMSIPVSRVPGLIGDVLVALVELLSIEGLKTLAHEALDVAVLMGIEAASLARADGLLELRQATPAEVVAWLQRTDPEMLKEISYWDDQDEAVEATACAIRDIAIAHRTELDAIERVLPKTNGNNRTPILGKLAALRKVASTCPDTILRRFVVAACDRLQGPTSSELIGCLTDDPRFEYLPGQLCIIDIGLEIDAIDDRFQYLNEASMNADDLAVLPLESEFDAIVPYLTRLTLCERLLIALAALLDSEPCLSELKSS